jgi:DNA-binding LacI/PurR family transcriptional regulator
LNSNIYIVPFGQQEKEMSRYEEIAETILKGINSGKFPLGSALPPEEKLREVHAASRTCIRNALKDLQDKGYIVKRQGSGSYVSQPGHVPPAGCINIGLLLNLDEGKSEAHFLQIPAFAQKIEGAREYLKGKCANLSLISYTYQAENPENELYSGFRVEGFLDFDMCVSRRLHDFFDRNKVSVVSCFPRHNENLFPGRHARVLIDDSRGAAEAVAHYASLGLKRFGYLGLSENAYTNFQMFGKVLAESGLALETRSVLLQPQECKTLHDSWEKLQYVADIVERNAIAPDVLFFDNFTDADNLITVLRERGLLVKCRFCANRAYQGAEISNQEFLDLIAFPNRQAGSKAAEILLTLIRGTKISDKILTVPSFFINNHLSDNRQES